MNQQAPSFNFDWLGTLSHLVEQLWNQTFIGEGQKRVRKVFHHFTHLVVKSSELSPVLGGPDQVFLKVEEFLQDIFEVFVLFNKFLCLL